MNCIEMKADEYGFYYPQIIDKKMRNVKNIIFNRKNVLRKNTDDNCLSINESNKTKYILRRFCFLLERKNIFRQKHNVCPVLL